MPPREMLLYLACVLSSLGVARLCSTGHAAYAVCGGTRFALGAAGVGLQGWHAVKRRRGGEGPKRKSPPGLVTVPSNAPIQIPAASHPLRHPHAAALHRPRRLLCRLSGSGVTLSQLSFLSWLPAA
jgi:hypothetical protein